MQTNEGKQTQKITQLLIIEDNPIDCDLIEAMLEQGMPQQYTLYKKRNLREALDFVSTHSLDIIITDLNLPDSNGLETFNRLHDQAPTVPIIVLSSVDDKSIAVQSVKSGAQDFIVKGELSGSLLIRSVLYSIERQRAEGQFAIFKRFAEIAGYGFCATHFDGQVTFMNKNITDILELSSQNNFKDLNFYNFYDPEISQRIRNEILPKVFDQGQWVGELNIISKRNLAIPTVHNIILLREEKTNIYSLGWLIIDMTASIKAEEHIQKLSLAVEQSPGAILIIDAKGVIEYVNPKFVEITGYTKDEMLRKNLKSLVPAAESRELHEQMWAAIRSRTTWRGEMCHRKKNGEFYWENCTLSPIKNPQDEITHFLVVKEDITVRKEYEKKLLQQAYYDDLTGLPNRVLALDRITQALNRAKRENNLFVVMFIDLDEFKKVNDTLGHPVGDILIQQAAKRLQNVIRTTDTVARLGGDEFLLILPGLKDDKYATYIARRLLDTFAKPFTLEGKEVYISASIGITVYPHDGTDPDVLLKNSDVAMYKAKEDSHNTFRYFKQEMNVKALYRINLEGELRRAIKEKQLFLEYQPIIDLNTNKILSAEALVRWNHPKQGIVEPDQFIPLAEDTELIIPLGDWVFHEACTQLKRWHAELDQDLTMSVNISVQQFRKTLYVESLLGALDEINLLPNYVQLEVTESLLIQNNPKILLSLKALNKMGMRLAIDDFGTGYSSLHYLKNFFFHTLKIDKSFIQGIAEKQGKNDQAVLSKAIISMAHSLGLKIVAEGIETEPQLLFLKENRCDLGQGFLFSKPLGSEKFVEFYKSYN